MHRSGIDGLRAPGGGGKRGGGGGGGKRAPSRFSLAVAVPAAGALLFAGLLLYSAHRFSSFEQGGGGMAVHRSGEHQLPGGEGIADGSGSTTSGGGGDGGGWLSAALLWAEDHQQQRLRAKAGAYQQLTGCGVWPCQAPLLQRAPTLVVYAYSAVDSEQQRSLAYFLAHGVEQHSWLTYRIVIASGPGVLPPASLPELPPNARYVHTSACANGIWGIFAAVSEELAGVAEASQYIVVVGSAARGPFLPPYTKQFMHWTDAFTSRLTARTKLVGSVLTCEGAPKGGDAAGEWRRNPFLLPHALATDREGLARLRATPEVLRCYGTPWEARYHSDSGAALALLQAGFNIDSLLSKYQGLDWWNQRTWDCNARVRPDAEWSYDGISITPYETVFVPVSLGALQSDWSFVHQADKYSLWADAQSSGTPKGNPNAFVSELWSLRGQRMVALNARGPACFDTAYYTQHNPDLASRAGSPQLLWEHFMLVGQFQGRQHTFTCPLQVGNTYRQAYLRARGRRCFDHDHYSKHNLDVRLAGVAEASALFTHYVDFGQFEGRVASFVCSDLMVGLPLGFDSRPLVPLPLDGDEKRTQRWQGLVHAAEAEAQAGTQRLEQQQQQQQQQQGAGEGSSQTGAQAQQQRQAEAVVVDAAGVAATKESGQQAAERAGADGAADGAAAQAAVQQATAAAAGGAGIAASAVRKS